MTVTNYPDVLGAITGGRRIVIGSLQTALALRPRVAKTGRPFEVILILQNTADVPLEVRTVLKLPEVDAKKQKGKFVAKNARFVIQMKPAEVGLLILPAFALLDTAPDDRYRAAVLVETKLSEKAKRIRLNDGGGAFDTALMDDERRALIESLQLLTYNGDNKSGRGTLEVPLPLIAGSRATLPDLQPSYRSIWRMEAYNDARPLLHHYGDLLLTAVFPKLRHNELYQPLHKTTIERFSSAGYSLFEPEIALIVKLMMLILEYAAPVERAHGFVAAGEYAVAPLLKNNPLALASPPKLPRYLRGLLRLIAHDPHAAEQPIAALTTTLYEDLLYDAGCYGFELLERDTGEDFGTPAEIQHHMWDMIQMLRAGDGLDFNRVYLPLILGGLTISELLPVSRESPPELLKSLSRIVIQRAQALDDDAAPILELTHRLIERTGQKYGIRSGV